MNTTRQTNLLIVGAGPFGLAMAAWAQDCGIDHLVVGKPMDLWKSNMPSGMILRSHVDWHLDPAEEHTIEAYLASRGLEADDVEPLSRDFYLGYAEWFQREKGIEPVDQLVQQLDRRDGSFEATLDNGETIRARKVLLAIGFRHFQNVPPELEEALPTGRYTHTCELVDFEPLRGKRCLIVGGRQSAFEWAALLAEHGAATVHVSHRHETPQFTDSEWSWINDMMTRFPANPGWYRNLSSDEKADVHANFAQAKIKLEPWIWPRINKENIKLWPNTNVISCIESPAGALQVRLDGDQTLTVDHVVLATGYTVDMSRLPFMTAGNLMKNLRLDSGYPVLDDQFQSSIPGLYVTSLPATQTFGPFFGFTVAVKASARVIAGVIAEDLDESGEEHMTDRAAMIGSGLIGKGWSVVFARAGWEVALYDIKKGRAAAAKQEAAVTLRYLEQEGLVDSAEQCIERLHPVATVEEAINGATYVQENVLETSGEKLEIFEQLDQLVAADVVCGSSSSTIPMSQFSEHLETRERCIIVHPMTPPYLVPVVEIVPAPWTSAATTDYAMDLMTRVGMTPIRLNKEIFGFVLNRFQVGLVNEAMYLVSEGIASPEDIEKTLTHGLGLRWAFMGMFENMDLLAITGFGEYAKKFGHSYTNLGKALATGSDWTDAAIDEVDDYLRKNLPIEELPERAGWRDEKLVKLTRALGRHK